MTWLAARMWVTMRSWTNSNSKCWLGKERLSGTEEGSGMWAMSGFETVEATPSYSGLEDSTFPELLRREWSSCSVISLEWIFQIFINLHSFSSSLKRERGSILLMAEKGKLCVFAVQPITATIQAEWEAKTASSGTHSQDCWPLHRIPFLNVWMRLARHYWFHGKNIPEMGGKC